MQKLPRLLHACRNGLLFANFNPCHFVNVSEENPPVFCFLKLYLFWCFIARKPSLILNISKCLNIFRPVA